MKLIFVVALVALSQFGYSQNLDCQKFKTGYFQNIDTVNGHIFIKRKKFQIEKDKNTGIEIKLEITWVDNCTYKLSCVHLLYLTTSLNNRNMCNYA